MGRAIRDPLMRPIYLDAHATTPCDPRVVAAMHPYWTEHFGNPSNPEHAFGREAGEAVERARRQIADLLNAKPKEIVLTSGTTESNHLALLGAVLANGTKRHVVTARTEHKAILGPVSILQEAGTDVTWLGTDAEGRIDPQDLRRALRPDTALVSLMHANNEIGTIHPIAEFAKIAHEAGALFHTDAAQTVGKEPLDVRALDVDLVSFSAHKNYGPKGVGALFIRERTPRIKLRPPMLGGGQEKGLRPSTQAVPLIVGMGEAMRISSEERASTEQDVEAFRDAFVERLKKDLSGWHLNGPTTGRLRGNLNCWIEGIGHARDLLALLPQIAASTGSSCSAVRIEPSHVLMAIGRTEAQALASFRFGFSKFLSMDDVHTAADAFIDAIHRARKQRG